jgi:hypothetical protein
MTTQFQIPSTIKCQFDVSGAGSYRRRDCGLAATKALIGSTYDRKLSYEGRCARHASIDKRRTYSRGEVTEFTPEIVSAMVSRIEELSAARVEEQARKNVEAIERTAAYKVQRETEAAFYFTTTRLDDQGAPDWDASRGKGEMVYGPGKPKWYVHVEGVGVGRGRYEASVMVERMPDFPTTLEVRCSSSIDLNQAEQLILALQAALAEARK